MVLVIDKRERKKCELTEKSEKLFACHSDPDWAGEEYISELLAHLKQSLNFWD